MGHIDDTPRLRLLAGPCRVSRRASSRLSGGGRPFSCRLAAQLSYGVLLPGGERPRRGRTPGRAGACGALAASVEAAVRPRDSGQSRSAVVELRPRSPARESPQVARPIESPVGRALADAAVRPRARPGDPAEPAGRVARVQRL